MILQFLLNYFLTEYSGGELKPLLELFEKNDFDIKRVIQNINPKDIIPLISTFLKGGIGKNKAPESEVFGGIEPIKNFADSEIVETLNYFFASND